MYGFLFWNFYGTYMGLRCIYHAYCRHTMRVKVRLFPPTGLYGTNQCYVPPHLFLSAKILYRRPLLLVLSAVPWVATVSGPNHTSDELYETQEGPCGILKQPYSFISDRYLGGGEGVIPWGFITRGEGATLLCLASRSKNPSRVTPPPGGGDVPLNKSGVYPQ